MNNNIKTTIIDGKISLSICNFNFILDDEQIEHIMNTNKKWLFDKEINIYPYYITHNKIINLIDFLYSKDINISIIINNMYDLRKENIIITVTKHIYQDLIDCTYKIIQYNQGHVINGKFFNPYWNYINNKNEENYLILCSTNYLIELSNKQYEKILNYEKTNNCKLTLCYAFIKNNRCIYSQHNKKQIFINSIINDFNIETIKFINFKNNIINDLTKDIAKLIYISNKSNNIDFIKKIERKNQEKMIIKDTQIKDTYNLLKIYRGHINKLGKDANIEKNRMWKIFDTDDNKNKYLMFCEPDDFIILCKKSIKIIEEFEKKNTGKITWHRHPNGYVQGSNNLYIHQVITGCHGNGKGTMDISVDHIDRDKLNNCFDNLKIATREEQQVNTKSSDGERRERKSTAKPLPDGLTNDMMKKYVVYYHECYNKEQKLYREFFKIEKHPKLDKPWISSKSNKISIFDKLKAANEMIDELNKNIDN